MSEIETDEERAARKARAAKRRRTLKIAWTAAGDPEPNWSQPRGAEGVALVSELTAAQWKLMGWELPVYDRKDMPIWCTPRGESD